MGVFQGSTLEVARDTISEIESKIEVIKEEAKYLEGIHWTDAFAEDFPQIVKDEIVDAVNSILANAESLLK